MKTIRIIAIGIIASTIWSMIVYANFESPVDLNDRGSFYDIISGDFSSDSSSATGNIVERLYFISNL